MSYEFMLVTLEEHSFIKQVSLTTEAGEEILKRQNGESAKMLYIRTLDQLSVKGWNLVSTNIYQNDVGFQLYAHLKKEV